MSGRQDTSIHQGLHLQDGTDYDTVVERVAHGGFGVIAFGPNRVQGQKMVAYKTLRRELLEDPHARATFVRECLLWIGLWPHLNIAGAYAVMEMSDAQGHRPFIALEYAENGSLRDLLRSAAQREPSGQLPLTIALHLAQQIAAGLAYLHTPDPAYLRNEPTVHRDLKPENVLLTGEGRAVITDFGLAKIVEEASPETLVTLAALLAGEAARTGVFDTQTATQTTSLTGDGTTMGTVAYMPPEQWRDARTAGPPADMYAFGIMLSELLAGRHALLDLEQRHTAEEWRAAHARPAPRLLRSVNSDIPLAVETLYLRCLARDPAGRPTAAEALATLQAGARTAGFEPYEPWERVEHTPFNEAVRWHKWSNAYDSFGRYEEALACNDRALPLARQIYSERPALLPMVCLTRGTILKGMGLRALRQGDRVAAARFDAGAEAAYQESLETRPPETTEEGARGRAFVWHQIGVLHNERSRWAEGDTAFTRALELKPGMADTYYNQALNMLKWGREDRAAGRTDDAIAHLRRARVYAVTSAGLNYPPAGALLESIEQDLRRLGVA